METKIKDIKGRLCPPGKVHHIRYITKNNVATTLCNEMFMPKEWEYTFNDEINCPACMLATIKRTGVIRRTQMENMLTKLCTGMINIGACMVLVGIILCIIN